MLLVVESGTRKLRKVVESRTILPTLQQCYMLTVRTAKHLLLESTTKSVESGTYDVICQFCTVKGMVVESEVLKAQNCVLSKFSLPMHCNVRDNLPKIIQQIVPESIFDKLFFGKLSCIPG